MTDSTPHDEIDDPRARAIAIANGVICGNIEYVPAVVGLFRVSCYLPHEGGTTFEPILNLYTDLDDLPTGQRERQMCTPEWLTEADAHLARRMDHATLLAVCRAIVVAL